MMRYLSVALLAAPMMVSCETLPSNHDVSLTATSGVAHFRPMRQVAQPVLDIEASGSAVQNTSQFDSLGTRWSCPRSLGTLGRPSFHQVGMRRAPRAATAAEPLKPMVGPSESAGQGAAGIPASLLFPCLPLLFFMAPARDAGSGVPGAGKDPAVEESSGPDPGEELEERQEISVNET